MKKTIFLLNGAPASGKDTAALIMQNELHKGSHLSFKEELYKIVANYFNIDLEKFRSLATDRTTKDAPYKELIRPDTGILARFIMWLFGFVRPVGYSPRQALIYVSEKVIKPKFGKDFFGQKLLETIEKVSTEFVYVSDSGFIDEIKPLVEAGHKVVVLRIHRNGCTFDGDSRTLLSDEDLAELGVKAIDIDNNKSLKDLSDNLFMAMVDSV